jgi:hypothetical protein
VSFDKGNDVRSTSSVFIRSEPTSFEVQLHQITVMEYLQECIWFDSITFVVYLVARSTDFRKLSLRERNTTAINWIYRISYPSYK